MFYAALTGTALAGVDGGGVGWRLDAARRRDREQHRRLELHHRSPGGRRLHFHRHRYDVGRDQRKIERAQRDGAAPGGSGYRRTVPWQNTNGQAAIWEMNGTNVINEANVGGNPGPSWKAIGKGDFNDDGHSDILWQNTNGQAGIWELNGTNVIGSGYAGANPGPSWKAIGTGDFNDDGHSDILWQNTNGQASIWENERGECNQRGRCGRQPWAELESDRNRRLQRRRPLRHLVAEHERSGRDLGIERDQRNGDMRAPTLDRAGKQSEQATSTTTDIPTSCGRTRTVRPRSGK